MLIIKKDIENRDDIILLVNSFYDKVKINPLIGFIFNEVMAVNWARHLPLMYDFWENTLFYTGGYTGNPMEKHRRLNRVITLTTEHFKEWIHLFNLTVNELFSGEKAELVKLRALNIAKLMQIKIVDVNNSLS